MRALPIPTPPGAQKGLILEVLGTPAPKGSFRVVTKGKGGVQLENPRVLKDSVDTELWHETVRRRAAQVCAERGRKPFIDLPLRLICFFYLLRPQGHYTAKGAIKKGKQYPKVKPDWDKLLRATLDPLEGIVFDGDSRFVDGIIRKYYAPIGTPTGAIIGIQAIGETP